VFAASGTTAYANSGNDAVGTNIIDLAPVLTANAVGGGDFGPGEEIHVITSITAAITGTAGFCWNPVLQTSSNVAFNTEELLEFPFVSASNSGTTFINGVAGATVASGNWALSGTNSVTLTVTTAVATGALQVGQQLTGTGLTGTITIVAQVSGTQGGIGVYTVTPSTNTTQAQLLTASGTYAGRQFGIRLPSFGLKRYLRMVWRTTTQNTAAGTAMAYMVKDPQNYQYGSIGYSVG
jgi:hypothetical protein